MANRTWMLGFECKFDAAHRLWNMPEGHPCGNLHGHTWKVRVGITANALNAQGFVIDFSILKLWVHAHVTSMTDHAFLNEVFENSPTCENLSQWIFRELKKQIDKEDPEHRLTLAFIRVEETEGHFVEYREDS